MQKAVSGRPAIFSAALLSPQMPLAVCALIAVWAAWSLPLLRVAPNRLLSGEPVLLAQWLAPVFAAKPGSGLLIAWLAGLALLFIGLIAAVFSQSRQRLHAAVYGGAVVFMGLLLALAGQQASEALVGNDMPFARVTLGSAFWTLQALAFLIASDALQRLKINGLALAVLLLLGLLPTALVLLSGWCQNLSLLKEFANQREVFAEALLRHIEIVALAMVATLLVGWPLAWAAHRHSAVGNSVFAVLNIVQTVPSIALFGLFMAPLAALALAYPALGRAGISGIGLAPAVLALWLYALLPVVRSGVAGLAQVPQGVVIAAKAMGMGTGRIFWQVEVPLALPIVLSGVRTAAVQAVGLAALTALVGAGGLGSILFEGLFSSANELVLLAVIPIVALAVLVDAAFKTLLALVPNRR